MQYSRESSDYIYGPGDIGGGNPIVFPDQEDIGEEDEFYERAQGEETFTPFPIPSFIDIFRINVLKLQNWPASRSENTQNS